MPKSKGRYTFALLKTGLNKALFTVWDCHVILQVKDSSQWEKRGGNALSIVDCQRQIVLRLAAIPERNRVNYWR